MTQKIKEPDLSSQYPHKNVVSGFSIKKLTLKIKYTWKFIKWMHKWILYIYYLILFITFSIVEGAYSLPQGSSDCHMQAMAQTKQLNKNN